MISLCVDDREAVTLRERAHDRSSRKRQIVLATISSFLSSGYAQRPMSIKSLALGLFATYSTRDLGHHRTLGEARRTRPSET